MKNSIKPSIWGPHGWKFLHYVSLGYPDSPSYEDKSNYKQFYPLEHGNIVMKDIVNWVTLLTKS